VNIKISIITVVLDNHKWIRDAVDSVLGQSYPDIEYIIIDGESRDGSLEIIRSYGERIHVVLSEPDKGIYDAMNKGLSLATGDVVGFLNSDDFYAHSEIVARVAEIFADPAVDVMYGDLDYVSLSDKSQVVRKWRSGAYDRKRFYTGWMPPHPTFFARKRIYDTFGGYNTQLHSSADYELMLRMGLVHKLNMAYLPEVMVKMRMGGHSNRTLTNRVRAHLEDWKVWEILNLKPRYYTLLLKPLQKLKQYWV
jgi:glycosyltransferase involved in cell wall biosynthesis